MRMRVASGMRVVMSSPLHTPFSETVPRINRQARIEKAEVARLQIRQLHTGPASTTITMGVLVVSPDGQPVAVHIRGPQSLIHVIPAIPACPVCPESGATAANGRLAPRCTQRENDRFPRSAKQKARCVNRSCGNAPYELIDLKSVTMLLSPDGIRNQKREGGHRKHRERQLFALWNGVHRMQRPTGRTEMVGVREQTRSPSYLVL
jgi:hypothetical protein